MPPHPSKERPVLLTGATGFIGQHLYDALRATGYTVRCASRDPDKARREHPGPEWVALDLDQPAMLTAALAGCDAAFYLVHELASGKGYEERERQAAQHFLAAAEAASLRRVVYLGGVAPKGAPSPHLASRLRTGEILRSGAVSTIEIRAAMIIGAGSASWRMVRDLAVRLPFMILPRWLRNRSRPIAIGDVIAALLAALELPTRASAWFDAPGPEVLTHREMLLRVAGLSGMRPRVVEVPFITPTLSSYWITLVTRCQHHVAQELVQGLLSDLVPEGEGIFAQLPDHRRVPFDEAARRALAVENRTVGPAGQLLEALAHRTSAPPRRAG